MSIQHKIVLIYTKDLSVEIPDVETFLLARERISKYKLTLDISSKPLKNRMIEVYTKLIYTDHEKSKKKAYFEMLNSTVVQIEEPNPVKEKLQKFILCDLQTNIFPKLQEAFIQILRQTGFPEAKLNGEVDFYKLFQQNKN
jgi:preprotein translocase subunit SecB|tara:strand:- start:335 stop:757 length:423 start_codon:yes stop_codon:yes gene_type:complete